MGKIHRRLVVFLSVCVGLGVSTRVLSANAKTLAEPVGKLIGRVIPGHEGDFTLESIPDADGKDVYELESKNGKIVIRGNNANAMARALGVYLRRYAKISVSWSADNPVQCPAKLPQVPNKTRVICDVKYRFFFNYCTFGYTMPFWNWREWERCIDWMALNGINMPLAITGSEKILMEVWKEQGFTQKQILGFFTDAAHLPWYHMNTISRWGGPCPESYVEYGYKLQKKILARERSLGMTPILQAFNGRVPVELKKQYPDKKITVLGKGWGMFKEPYYTYFLDPYDPLFAKLQKSFIEHTKKLYGTDHLYGVDPFNEITPPSWEPEYLAKTAKRIYETMAAADKNAVWIQMGWLFYFDKHWTEDRIKALLTAVPNGNLIMLDYYCESRELWKTTKAFFDTPFIWCYLGGFGGKECLAGPLPTIKERFNAALKERGGKNLWGMGSTLEGFGVNMMTYEFLFDMPWSDRPDNLDKWIVEYAESRAGNADQAVVDAWKFLLKKVYNRNSSGYSGGGIIHIRPRFEGSCGFVVTGRNFKPKDLMVAWTMMMKAAPETVKRDSFQYDLVNVIRQYFGDVSANVRAKMREAYLVGNKEDFDKYAAIFIELLKDQETLVRSRPEFLMGKWIEEARAIGADDDEKEKLEWSVRNILTTWGGRACPLIEYANRDWDGLTRDYYLKRWEMFVEEVDNSLSSGKPFNQNVFDGKAADFEWNFVNKNRNKYQSAPTGNSWEIATRLFNKYSKLKLDILEPSAHKVKIAAWNDKNITAQYAKYSWDVSKYMNKKGKCLVTFDYKRGRHALEMRNAVLKCNGVVIGEDKHAGWTGNDDRGNVFTFKIDELVPAAKYVLEAEMRGAEGKGTSSFGDITMEIFTLKH